jgi:hypothetical protein
MQTLTGSVAKILKPRKSNIFQIPLEVKRAKAARFLV